MRDYIKYSLINEALSSISWVVFMIISIQVNKDILAVSQLLILSYPILQLIIYRVIDKLKELSLDRLILLITNYEFFITIIYSIGFTLFYEYSIFIIFYGSILFQPLLIALTHKINPIEVKYYRFNYEDIKNTFSVKLANLKLIGMVIIALLTSVFSLPNYIIIAIFATLQITNFYYSFKLLNALRSVIKKMSIT